MASSRSEMHADKSGSGSSLDHFLQPSCGLLSFAVWWSGLLFQSGGFRSHFQQEGTFESGVDVSREGDGIWCYQLANGFVRCDGNSILFVSFQVAEAESPLVPNRHICNCAGFARVARQ